MKKIKNLENKQFTNRVIYPHSSIKGIVKINEIKDDVCYAISYIHRNTKEGLLPYIYFFDLKKIEEVEGDKYNRVKINSKIVKSLNPEKTKEYLKTRN